MLTEAAMPAFIVVFREILEIALIVSVLLAATVGVPQRGRYISLGIAAGVVGSVVVALFVDAISAFADNIGQELFNATILFAATLMIGWTVVWMRRHARELTEHVKQIGKSVMEKRLPMIALSAVVFLAVLREGAEIVLFSFGFLASGVAMSDILIGSALGGLVGMGIGIGLYLGLIRIPTRYMFSVTSWLLMFVAAGMAAHAAGYLDQAGLIPASPEWLTTTLWDSSWLLAKDSTLGQILHVLLGYDDSPTGAQLVCYSLTVGIIYTCLRLLPPVRPHAAPKPVAA